jgi:hypothetical protein
MWVNGPLRGSANDSFASLAPSQRLAVTLAHTA